MKAVGLYKYLPTDHPESLLDLGEALFDRMGVERRPAAGKPPETLLVIAGAGGVGSIAIQIGEKLAGMRVIATASRPETQAWCRELGADEVINHGRPFADELARIGDGSWCSPSPEPTT